MDREPRPALLNVLKSRVLSLSMPLGTQQYLFGRHRLLIWDIVYGILWLCSIVHCRGYFMVVVFDPFLCV